LAGSGLLSNFAVEITAIVQLFRSFVELAEFISDATLITKSFLEAAQ
jgi:hypothetical protein